MPARAFASALVPALALLAVAGCERAPGTAEPPFAQGALAVVAPEGREAIAPEARGAIAPEAPGVRAWTLVPCRGGAAACLGGPEGPAGEVRAVEGWTAVGGPGGLTFWLAPGGVGVLEGGGRRVPLAWAPRMDGTGAGDEPALGSRAPHG